MGICISCESNSLSTTAKLIFEDGRLQEYPYPVRVSYILQKHPACFICNSDDMGYDAIAAAAADEELQPGNIYFALPLSRLKRRLRAEDMAALAVRASAALGGSAVVFAGNGGGGGGEAARRRGKFPARLNAIPE